MAIASVIALPFLIRGWIYDVRQSNAWDLRNKMYTALREAEKSPPGLERAEKYLARLKAIDNPYAPDEANSKSIREQAGLCATRTTDELGSLK